MRINPIESVRKLRRIAEYIERNQRAIDRGDDAELIWHNSPPDYRREALRLSRSGIALFDELSKTGGLDEQGASTLLEVEIQVNGWVPRIASLFDYSKSGFIVPPNPLAAVNLVGRSDRANRLHRVALEIYELVSSVGWRDISHDVWKPYKDAYRLCTVATEHYPPLPCSEGEEHEREMKAIEEKVRKLVPGIYESVNNAS